MQWEFEMALNIVGDGAKNVGEGVQMLPRTVIAGPGWYFLPVLLQEYRIVWHVSTISGQAAFCKGVLLVMFLHSL